MLLPFILATHAPAGDGDLITRLHRRDPQALGELYDRYGRLAYSLILRAVRDARTAEDLVEETFLRVWNRVRAFDDVKGSAGPWVLAVARHRAIDYLRASGVRERPALEPEPDDPALYTGMDADILASDRARRLKAAAEKLPANQCQPVELAYFEGLSPAEIADRMGQPLDAVQTWLRAAFKSLRDTVDPGAAPANHEGLRDSYELFAMGVAGEPARREIGEHLARGCESCVLEMRRARQFAALLGATTPPLAPSPKLRRRILASAGFDPRRFGWAPFLGLATALALFGAFYFSSREHQIAAQSLIMREQMRQQTIELTRLHEAFAILSGPATEIPFGPSPQGKVYIDRSRGVLLIASGLAPAPAGKLYEMWTIPKGPGAKAAAAGLFQPDSNGAAIHLQPGAVSPNLGVVAVTLEDESGALAPTSAPLISAALP